MLRCCVAAGAGLLIALCVVVDAVLLLKISTKDVRALRVKMLLIEGHVMVTNLGTENCVR